MTAPCADLQRTNAERAKRVLTALGVDERLYSHASTAAFAAVPGIAGMHPALLEDAFDRWEKASSLTVRLVKAKALTYFSENSIQQALGAAVRALASNETVASRIPESVVVATAYSGKHSLQFGAAAHSGIESVSGTALNGSTAFVATRRGPDLEVDISEGEFTQSFRQPFTSWNASDIKAAVAKAICASGVYDHDKRLVGKLARSEEEFLTNMVRVLSDKRRLTALRGELERLRRPSDLDCVDLRALLR